MQLVMKHGVNPRTGKRAVIDMVYEHLKANEGVSFSAAKLQGILKTKYSTDMDSNRLYFVLLRLVTKAAKAYPNVYRVGHAAYQYNSALKAKNGSGRLNGTKMAGSLVFGKGLAANKAAKAARTRKAATKVATRKTPKTVTPQGLFVDTDAVILRDRSGAYYIAWKVK